MRVLATLLFVSVLSFAESPRSQIENLLVRGERTQAVAIANQYLSEIERRSGQDSAEMPEALDLLARTVANGKPEATPKVREIVNRSLTLRRKLSGPDDPGVADSLAILGVQQWAAGAYDESRTTLEEALALVNRTRGSDSEQAASLSLQLSQVFWIKGDYPRCQMLGQHALDVSERLLGPDHPSVADALTSLGSDYSATGDYSRATPLFERALLIQEHAFGPTDPRLGRTLNKLAFNLLAFGDTPRAKAISDRAVSILEAAVSDRDSVTGEAQRVLGNVLTQLGDYPGAERAHMRALEILEKTAGPDSVVVSDTLVTLGNAAKDAGDYTRAAQLARRAASIYEARLGPENTKVGGALDNLGQALVLLKQYDEARNVFERAIVIQSKALGPRSAWVANLYQGLAKVEAATGHYEEARQSLQLNLDIWREQLGPNHPFTVASMNLLAEVLARSGERDSARKLALEAVHIRHEDVAFTVRTIDERQALQYSGKHTTGLDTVLSLARTGSSADRQNAWDAVIRTRALVLDEMAARHRFIRESSDPTLSALVAAATNRRAQLAKLVMQGKGSVTPAAYLQRLDEDRMALDRSEQALALKSASFRTQLQRERAGFKEVSSALPVGSAIVAFVRYDRRQFSTPDETPVPSYLAFVMRCGDAAPYVFDLGAATRLDKLVENWRAQIDRERLSEGHSQRVNEASYRIAGAALRRAAWDPITPAIAGVRTVFIVPDSALELVNFASLPAGATNFLLETGPLLHTLSAERDLAQPAASISVGDLLAVGDPAFRAAPNLQIASAKPAPIFRGAHSACADFANLRFEALPGSALEIRSLLDIWRKQGGTADLLMGAQATEAAVKEHAPGKRVLHLATHGFFFPEVCREPAVLKENPLLRSGLALAGANLRSGVAAGAEDGILTAEEAASLDLRGTEWVVLSGCDTGLGDIQTGEGVLGLRRAFQESGARTVITSLWPVEDQETREWMQVLYRARFTDHSATAVAVREASLRTLQHRRAAGKSTHPFHWASFVAVGDWR